MGLVEKNDPIFFYLKLSQSATGNAFDWVVTPSAIAVLRKIRYSSNAQCPVCPISQVKLGTEHLNPAQNLKSAV